MMGDSSITLLCGYSDIKQKNLKKNKKYLLSPIDNIGNIVYSIIKIKEIRRYKK